MAAITKAIESNRKDGVIVAFPVLASQKIYKGTSVFLNATSKLAFTNDGTSVALAAGDIYAGECVETIDNSTGADGDKKVRVYFGHGISLYPFPNGDGIHSHDIGKTVYVNNDTDNAVVTITKDAVALHINAAIGYLVGVESTDLGWVSTVPGLTVVGVANGA